MFPEASILCMFFSVWTSCSSQTLVSVGPCVGDTKKATIDCSRRNLTFVPQHIWPNVTELDLSENHLSFFAKSLTKLRHLDRLIKLNLSRNDLPLLVKQSVYHFPSLEILDLSGCRLAAVEPGALLNFPRLRKLILSVNDLQTPMSAVLQGHGSVEVVDHNIILQASDRTKDVVQDGGIVYKKERQSADDLNMDTQSLFLRKLLVDVLDNTNATEANDKKSSESWKYLVAALVIAVSLSVLIAIGAKCKLFHRYLASFRHSRLSEADGASQCDTASLEVGFSNRNNIPNLNTEHANLEEDDDGFIEDNYIQASEQERAARETQHWQEEDEDEDEDIDEFSIG